MLEIVPVAVLAVLKRQENWPTREGEVGCSVAGRELTVFSGSGRVKTVDGSMVKHATITFCFSNEIL